MSATSLVIGLRYLTEANTAYIVDYFRNGAGYAPGAMEAYFDLIVRGYDAWTVGGDARTLTIASRATDAGYGRMNPMRNYVYGRVNQPDALGVLYLTLGASTIVNVDDGSFSVLPEVQYKPTESLDCGGWPTCSAVERGRNSARKRRTCASSFGRATTSEPARRFQADSSKYSVHQSTEDDQHARDDAAEPRRPSHKRFPAIHSANGRDVIGESDRRHDDAEHNQFVLTPLVVVTPPRLIVALVANCVFGALVPLGIGRYGPSLVLFSLLGMEPRAAFPIMMGSGAFMGLVAAMRFVSSGRYSARAALGLTLGGVPGVLVAVWLVRSLPLDIVRWGVIVVVLYTAVTLIRSAVEERRTLAAARADVPVGL